MHQKQFLSLWYVWRKPCTYHAPTLTLSPNGKKRDSTYPTSSRSSIGCVQNNFWALWYTWCEPCTYLAPRLALPSNGLIEHPHEPHQLGVLSGVFQTISEPMVCLAQTVHLSYTVSNTIFEWTDARFDMTHAPRSSIRCGSKTISEPIARSAWTVHLSYVKISCISKCSEPTFYLSLIT
jgi:hypothetical protein